MKNTFLIALILILSACNSSKKYSDFDFSYSRNGGYARIYENLFIKDHRAFYEFQQNNKKYKLNFVISSHDLEKIELAAQENNFRMISEDHKKLYDNITTTINIKKGNFSGIKTDASEILPSDLQRWQNMTSVFRLIIENNVPANHRN